MGLRRDVILFPGGKEKALTFSYDDAVTQDGKLIELMDRYRLKGTFNINTGLLGREDSHTQDGKTVPHNKWKLEDIPRVYHGQELAVHGLTHLDLAAVGSGVASYEIMADRAGLEEITKTPVRGMAYPFGTHSPELTKVLEACQIAYARTVESTGSFELPENFLHWNPTCHHNDPELFLLAEKFLSAPGKNETPRLFYVWGHSYEFDVYDNWDRMERFMEQMSGHDDIWYASNIQIWDYVNAARHLVYSANGNYIFNPTVYDIWISTGNETALIRAGESIALQEQ